MSENDKCPIWGCNEFKDCTLSPCEDGVAIAVNCAHSGGRYRFAKNEYAQIAGLSESAKICLSAWIAEQNLLGNVDAVVGERLLRQMEMRHPPSMPERFDLALQWLVRQSSLSSSTPLAREKGQEFLTGSFAAFSYSSRSNAEEWKSLIPFLREQEVVRYPGSNFLYACVTAKGYARYEELRRKTVDSSRVFLAMWFGEEMDAVYDKAIAPAIHDAGYEPVRVDREEHLGKIDDEIIAQIRRARFVVADFTAAAPKEPRGGVYYEAGFAYGLGREVVYTCRADFVDALHFDTRQFNHIVWHADQLPDFRKALRNRIERAIGVGPKKPPDGQDK